MKRTTILLIIGLTLLALGLAPIHMSTLEGWETQSYPNWGTTIPWSAGNISVWWKTGSLDVASAIMHIYTGDPVNDPTAAPAGPSVYLTHITEDAWQGEVQMTYMWGGIEERVIQPGDYWYYFVGADVDGTPTWGAIGPFSFGNMTSYSTLIIAPALNGLLFPVEGTYRISQGKTIAVYFYQDSGYRLSRVLVNMKDVAVFNPLAAAVVSDMSVLAEFAVNQAPVPAFSIGKSQILIDEAVSFDASGSTDFEGPIAEYHWDFGDANTDEGGFVTHSYDLNGTFTVTLTVVDQDGLSAERTKELVVSTAPDTPVPTTYTLTVEASMGGTTMPPPKTYDVEEYEQITVEAVSENGWVLEYWTVNQQQYNASAEIIVTITEDMVVRAQFKEIESIPVIVELIDIILPQAETASPIQMGLLVFGGVLVASSLLMRRKERKGRKQQ